MQHFWRDDDHGFVWHAGPSFGSGVHSPPVHDPGPVRHGLEFAQGNFELCVAVDGQVQHWWRNNAGDGGWRQSATFGHDVQAVAGLVEGSFGFNLEVVVLRTDRQLQHYWRDGAGWHEGVGDRSCLSNSPSGSERSASCTCRAQAAPATSGR